MSPPEAPSPTFVATRTSNATLVARLDARNQPDDGRIGHLKAMLERAAHPGVVAVHPGNDPMVVDLVFVGHHTLETWRPHTTGDVGSVVAALATTVADLHRIGVVHGSIHPTHVVINDQQQPVLCGWSRSGVAGEPRWFDGRPLHPPRDVHSLGVLLQHLINRLPDSRRHRPTIDAWTSLIAEATQRDPHQRPTAQAFAQRVASTSTVPHAAGRHADRGRHADGEMGATRAERAGYGRYHRSPLVAAGLIVVVAAVALFRASTTADAANGAMAPPPRAPSTTTTASRPDAGRSSGTPPCDAALVPIQPPVPTPPCTSSVPGPTEGLLVGATRYRISDTSVELLAADWQCVGAPNVVAIDPATGMVYAFATWATVSTSADARIIATVAPGSHLETGQAADQSDGCIGTYARQPDRTTQLLSEGTQ